MKSLSPVLLIVSRAALLLISAIEPSQAASGGARLYDGTWSVVVQTTRGDCPVALRAGVRIVAGRLLADDQAYAVEGRVSPDGSVRVKVSAGSQAAGGFGRLSQNAGQGLWRTRSGECAGKWTAARE
jgi:hypothetical protein